MPYPNFNEERKLWRKGYKWVAGLDEVGRGPLAGPVVAVALLIKNPNVKIQNPSQTQILNAKNLNLKKIKDSKRLSSKKREEIFETLKEISEIEWGIGRVSEKVIDRINILEATKLAMKRAVINLEKKLKTLPFSIGGGRASPGSYSGFLILDGNFRIPLDISQKPIVKADEKVFSCALASIIAKVKRDRMMKNYHKKYPQYGFDRHKGYPTKLHKEMLKNYGFCKIHRKSFKN